MLICKQKTTHNSVKFASIFYASVLHFNCILNSFMLAPACARPQQFTFAWTPNAQKSHRYWKYHKLYFTCCALPAGEPNTHKLIKTTKPRKSSHWFPIKIIKHNLNTGNIMIFVSIWRKTKEGKETRARRVETIAVQRSASCILLLFVSICVFLQLCTYDKAFCWRNERWKLAWLAFSRA